MNNNFFKIESNIYIKDILKILDISNSLFLDSNQSLDPLIINNEILDFVSFNNLETNKLSYFSNKKKNAWGSTTFAETKFKNTTNISST